jgi:formylglycine-generating enzyme required for sulfatase activity
MIRQTLKTTCFIRRIEMKFGRLFDIGIKFLFMIILVMTGITAAKANSANKGYENMVLIPFGEFRMGDGEHYDDPGHKVVLSNYYIDKYEASNARYEAFMKGTKHSAPAYWDDNKLNKPEQPVVGVNWFDADAFCKWEGKRLPAEAEWEKAAKGPDQYHYPWGHQYDSKKSNCCENIGATTPVDSYPEGVSGYGVYNMAGNVYEWVADWYEMSYYSKSPALNPKGPEKGVKWGHLGMNKVLRGGSWFAPESSQHTGHRFWNKPENNSYGVGLGFRCAKSATDEVLAESEGAYMESLILMGAKKYATALEAIDKALTVDPGNKEYLEIRDELRTKIKGK